MKVTINIHKSVQENAAFYYERAKHSRKKIEGAKKAYEITLEKIKNFEAKAEPKEVKAERKKEWYERFRWYKSSDGKIVIGGRDATTNDIIVKKYTEEGDLVFHTEMPGSPFVVIKAEKKQITEQEINEAAEFCATNSKAWNQGLGTSDVFYVKPSQLKQDHGLGKGSFNVDGPRTFIKGMVQQGIGLLENGMVMGGPLEAVKKNCKHFFMIKQGSEKKSDIAKDLKYKFKKLANVDAGLDDLMQALPPGEGRIMKKSS